MTRERAKRLIFLVWSVVFLITILCHVSTLLEFLSHIYITLVSFFIIAFNVYLLKKARDQHRTIKRHTVVITGEKKSMTSEYRSLFRLTMVTFTFAVVAIYNVVFTIFRFSRPTKEYFSYQRMVVAGNILFAINSSFDPFVYCITSREFKRIFLWRRAFTRNVGILWDHSRQLSTL